MTMNKQPLSGAQDADLRASQAAMERAAKRARQIAAQTGTELVFSRGGVVEHVLPDIGPTATLAQEPSQPYKAD